VTFLAANDGQLDAAVLVYLWVRRATASLDMGVIQCGVLSRR
jgi:hypothetical protein